MTDTSETKGSKKIKGFSSPPRNGSDISHNPLIAFITLFFAIAIISFLLGCVARLYIISHEAGSVFNKSTNDRSTPVVASSSSGSNVITRTKVKDIKLPSPKLPRGKRAPMSTYSSKTLFKPISAAAFTSNTVHLDKGLLKNMLKPMTTKDISGNVEIYSEQDTTRTTRPMAMKRFNLSGATGLTVSHFESDETVHYPSGQHLVSMHCLRLSIVI
jgi:hypothetical protein